jgi:hypothetical protein
MLKLGLSVFFAAILITITPGVPRAAGAKTIISVGCDNASLVQAINDANSQTGKYSGQNTLELAAGCVYTLREPDDGHRDNLLNGLASITSEITISGHHAIIERDSASPAFRIFHVAQTGVLTLEELTIRNGSLYPDFPGVTNPGYLAGVSYFGGSIQNDGGVLNLYNCALSGNRVQGGQGGGMAMGKGGRGGGGGIANFKGVVNISQCTISGNTAVGGGGSSRSGAGDGGGIANYGGVVNISDSTISGNSAGSAKEGSNGHGGGIFSAGGTLTLKNTLVSGNEAIGAISGGADIYTTDKNPVDEP